jgi:hypothetical protein
MATTAAPTDLQEAVRRMVEVTRRAQGLPLRVEDPSALRMVARLVSGP